MLFQFPLSQPGGQITNVMWTLQQWGLLDAFLPFLLFFALIFATLQKIQLFKSGDKPDRKMNGAIAFVISALIVVPHITRSYPPQLDPINIVLNILPQAGIIFLVLFLVLVMIGLTAKEIPTLGSQIVAFFALLLLGLVVVFAIWPAFTPSWLNIDPNTQALVITLLLFGGVVWFITREEAEDPSKGGFNKFIKDFFGKGG